VQLDRLETFLGTVQSGAFHCTADRRGLRRRTVSTRIKALAPYGNMPHAGARETDTKRFMIGYIGLSPGS
jgi:hypothetical protein